VRLRKESRLITKHPGIVITTLLIRGESVNFHLLKVQRAAQARLIKEVIEERREVIDTFIRVYQYSREAWDSKCNPCAFYYLNLMTIMLLHFFHTCLLYI